MQKFTCTKIYDNIPIGHRQPNHSGHCSRIHGHDWSFTFTFGCEERDPVTGFVMDFGDLKDLKASIEKFDHALALNKTDIKMYLLLSEMSGSGFVQSDYFKVVWIDDCTCEGFAQYFHQIASDIVSEKTGGRVWVESVVVHEGRVNSATYSCPGDCL